MILRPQPGPQELFLSSPADIAIIGGGNDGGKTFGLLMDASRHCGNPNFGAVYFRRETPQLTQTGGLWEEAQKMYGAACRFVTSPRHVMTFPSAANVTFSHMQHTSDRFNWDGAQIPGLYFDQLEQFEEEQFWHLVGRNRGNCGVRPFIRASCNPKPDCWLSRLLQWWWDPETGYAIKERSGVIRWFRRDEDGRLVWYDADPKRDDVKSITFVLALIDDNKIALKADPQRLSNLLALPYVERERRRFGNWKIRDITGDGLFKPDWWKYLRVMPKECTWVRAWDIAGGVGKTADRSAGCLMGLDARGRVVIGDVTFGRWSPAERNAMMRLVCERDAAIEARGFFEKGYGIGMDMTRSIQEALMGYSMFGVSVKGSKKFRADPLAAQAEAGNVYLVDGDWNEEFVYEASQFTGEESTATRKDDLVDAASLAFGELMRWK